jgi:hypothetical protein
MNKAQLYWDTIKGAIKNPFFIMFLIGLVTTWSNGDTAGIVASVIAFVGIKTIVNIGTPTSEADKQLSMVEHFFLSSRTWVAVFGVIFCYYTRMPVEMKEIVIALAGGFGLDQIAVAVKGMNFDRFVKAPNVIVNQPQMPQAPQIAQPYQPPVQIESPSVSIPATATPAPVPQLKDKLKLMREYYSKDKNYREYMLGGSNATVAKWIDKFVEINPMATTVEIAKKIALEYFNRTLTIQECSTIQGILGLEAVIKSMADVGIVTGFFLAFDKFKELAYLEKIFRDGTVAAYTINTINEAATRAGAGDKDITKASLALQEFGVSAYEAEHSQWSGNRLKGVYKLTPATTGGANSFNLEDFNPYSLAGYTPEGQPL